MKILVTGITGRVGANVARHFLENGHEVRGLVWEGDRQSEKLEAIGAEIVEGDLASSADVNAAAAGREVILHLGAAFQAGGPFTSEQYFDTNVKGTFNVLEAAAGLGDQLRHLIFTSTDATLSKYPPEGMDRPVAEDTVPQGTTDWYGYSKILGEHLVDRYVRHHGLRATVVRFPMVWGAGEVLTYPQFRLAFFLNRYKNATDEAGKEAYRQLKALEADGDRLIIACDKNGRPWKKHCIEVRDIVHAYDRAAGNENTYGKTYQLGGPAPFTWDDVVPVLAKHLDLPVSRMNLPGTPTYYEFDLSAAKRDFGYDPQVGMQEMIEEAARFRNEGGGRIIPTHVLA
ncbi:MAG: NAD(P)-dependent oxidoreductase [Dehalococcoidia bacterium]